MTMVQYPAVAQLDRVPDSDSGGRGFESRQPYQDPDAPIRGAGILNSIEGIRTERE